MFSAIHSAPPPVIAKVHGPIFGGGVGMTAACDYVIADQQTQFCFSEVRIGIVPAVISPFVFQKMNPGFAHAMMVTGVEFSANQAWTAGLVHEVHESAHLDVAVARMLSQLGRNGPLAMRTAKRLSQEMSPFQPIAFRERVCSAIAEVRVSPEGQEGLAAFLEKRKPSWTGST
jgi:methylglutaconyl-CoA hydratase